MSRSLTWHRESSRQMKVESFLLTAGSVVATVLIVVIFFFVVFLSRAQ